MVWSGCTPSGVPATNTWRSAGAGARWNSPACDTSAPIASRESRDVVVAAVAVDRDQHVDVGVGEQAAQLVGGRERADRHRDRADARHRQPADDEVEPGREQDADVRAAARAPRDEATADRPGTGFGLGVGEPIVVADHHGGVAALVHLATEHRADGGGGHRAVIAPVMEMPAAVTRRGARHGCRRPRSSRRRRAPCRRAGARHASGCDHRRPHGSPRRGGGVSNGVGRR